MPSNWAHGMFQVFKSSHITTCLDSPAISSINLSYEFRLEIASMLPKAADQVFIYCSFKIILLLDKIHVSKKERKKYYSIQEKSQILYQNKVEDEISSFPWSLEKASQAQGTWPSASTLPQQKIHESKALDLYHKFQSKCKNQWES